MYHDLNGCMPGILGKIKPILRVKPCHVIISLELWKLNTALSLFALHIFKWVPKEVDLVTVLTWEGPIAMYKSSLSANDDVEDEELFPPECLLVCNADMSS